MRLSMDVTEQIEDMYTDKYEDLVRIYKSRAGENDVEDVVQEAFYRALLYKDSFNPEYISLSNWLTSILNNCLRDMLREKRDGAVMHDSEHEPTIDDRCPSDTELEAKILKGIEAKGGNTRQILWLYFIMGCKADEIHQTVGGSYSAVTSRVEEFKRECQAKYGHLMED
jgi:RNA polymerase sigma factor (sigma-70 family)